MLDEDFDVEQSQTGRSKLLSGLVKVNRYLLALLIVPAGLIYFWPPFEDQKVALEKLDGLTVQRDSMKARAALMEQKLELIQKDEDYLEAMARDRLHLQKDGEVIVRFEDGNGPVK
ncbi:hypothetical protein FEM03_10100 [Phragmitibacter flavus]|uniref:Septum formation initiator family protein n=1 Tax=Phragmitibacter flavus TaxID=2576071 RepID=A0A5R8KEF3_9BACT|nr:septum formation initiator family protein [Phragmitibacter flavus]TLD70660.1 hypothetical protein FEM03_10100 [Phragmitibacter flavus]